MKIRHLASLLTLAVFLTPLSGSATVIGVSTVEQPVNLGIKSDPARIPLGAVGVVNNHGYGVQRMIGEARVCPGGAMQWAGGSELDQNLASVFGISVEAQDETQISVFPVTLRMKNWKPPGYSPYTKEQALAATLWCLLRSVGGTPEKPLDVRVVAEGMDDKPLEAIYSGKYVTRPDKVGEDVPPLKVTGTVLEEDARGVAWVVFPEVSKKPSSAPPACGLIVLEELYGDVDPCWHLLPVWGNGVDENEDLEAGGRSAIMCYSNWRSKGVREANSFIQQGGAGFEIRREENLVSASISYPRVKQETLAANILALVISAQPTEARPLLVSLSVEEAGLAAYPAFRNSAGWKLRRTDDANIHYYVLECEFAWDAAAQKLTRGTLPCVVLESPGRIIPDPSPEEPPGGPEEQIARTVRNRIIQGIHDGTLLAEKNIAPYKLSESPLERRIALAGYYEAMATYSNETRLPNKPVDDPVRLGHDQFDQHHRNGWVAGMNLAEAFAIEARDAMVEAEKKKERQADQ